jgi:hypothetical protein
MTSWPPSGAEIRSLEAQSRRQGSGLGRSDLVGCWRLDQLWGKRDTGPNTAAAALLRAFNASLTLTANGDACLGDDGLTVQNSVQLGALQLRFQGQGHLRGRRPLLEFWFEELVLQIGTQILWRQAITTIPEPRRRPFFALIGTLHHGANQVALLARGRGGGLALWRRET